MTQDRDKGQTPSKGPIPADCIVLRLCKACGRYEWMQEWQFHCVEHQVQARKANERRQRLREVKSVDPGRMVFRAKWNRRRGRA